MKKSRLLGAVCAVWMLMFAFSYTAHATTYFEFSDAGETILTALPLPVGTTAIVGGISTDADMYSFYWGGGMFQADTFGTAFDTQLFLFDSTGAGVWANDDAVSACCGFRSEIIDAALAAGTYFIAISAFNNDPRDGSNGLLFTSSFFVQEGPLGSEVLASWDGSTSHEAEEYFINFYEATSMPPPIPVPAAVWLFGSGLLGLIGIARRKKAA